jgi:hypothetical protein
MISLRPANWPYEALVTCAFATLCVRKCTGHAEPPSVASRKPPAAGAVRRARTPLSRAKPPPLPRTTASAAQSGCPDLCTGHQHLRNREVWRYRRLWHAQEGAGARSPAHRYRSYRPADVCPLSTTAHLMQEIRAPVAKISPGHSVARWARSDIPPICAACRANRTYTGGVHDASDASGDDGYSRGGHGGSMCPAGGRAGDGWGYRYPPDTCATGGCRRGGC